MANIIFQSIVTGRSVVSSVPDTCELSGNDLYALVEQKEAIPCHLLTITLNGKAISRSADLIPSHGSDMHIQMRLLCPGGKGGFGSMLRAIGAQIEKTTNKDACRDLSGRRLRDVNAEKKIKEYIAKQAKRKEQENKKRKEKLQRLRREPKIEFKDEEYFKTRSELPDQVDDAVMQGMKKVLSASQKKVSASATVTSASCVSSTEAPVLPIESVDEAASQVPSASVTSTSGGVKRKYEATAAAGSGNKNKMTAKSCLWLGIDEEDISSDED